MIAVGYEGGGHLGRDDIGSMVLTPRIVESVKIPVLASGGIADGRGLAAALALGAEGIELGTRFVAVKESNAHHNYQHAADNLKAGVLRQLADLKKLPIDELLEQRYQKFRNIGKFGHVAVLQEQEIEI